jgi:pimeloyl-ACP methyl ester carboxylesterase
MTTTGRRIASYERSGLRFEVRDDGPVDASPIVLLHGWPGGAITWSNVSPVLVRAGHRTLAADQRGYSSGARPVGRRSYAMVELVADVVALLDAAGLERGHVVGHDWGGAVAWATAASAPERVASLTVLSTPHPAALARSLWSSDQLVRSGYIGWFQMPWLPESLLLARDGALFRSALRRSGLTPEWADRYVDRQREPGALTASLSWYRAIPLNSLAVDDTTVPTRYVWGSGDSALGPRAAALTADHVAAEYGFDRLEGASHWLPEMHPDLVAAAILDQVHRTAGAPVRDRGVSRS